MAKKEGRKADNPDAKSYFRFYYETRGGKISG